MEGLNSDNGDEGDKIHNDGDDSLDADFVEAPNAESERIFRSSLCGMFEESQSSKTDACAVFCCGIYLWQRNQDLFVREDRKEDGFGDDAQPSSSSAEAATTTSITTISSTIARRPFETAFLVLVAVTLVLWSLDDPTTNNLFSKIIKGAVAMLIFCVLWKGYEFQRARKKLRLQLAIVEYYRRRCTDNNEIENENDPDLAVFLRKHRQEIFGDGGHDICGCARSDLGCFDGHRRRSNCRESEISDVDDDQNNHRQGFCDSAWRFLGNLCCRMLCGCHLQLLGICAIAQESRHLQDTLPANTRPGLWQRDYITMQPWMEYYPSILRLRLSNEIHCLPHFKALSRLSRQILLAAIALLLFVTSMFLLPIRFPKWQVLILYGTLLQPAIFLFFVHWLWNRLDLSLDAVVKYFACGFFICTSTAVVYEYLVSKVAQKFLMLVGYLGSEGLELFEDHTRQLPNGEQHIYSSHVEHPLWYQLTLASLTAFVNAFFVAGMTEEICKYLCFWMVEHPDLELQNKVMLPLSSVRRETNGHPEKSDHGDTETTKLLPQDQTASLKPSDSDQQIIFAPTASLVSVGEAITVAMITVALGFACAENLLYIFVYTPPGLSSEISTLYVRCLFPIHPMAAALQSIGVCRRDLEKDSSIGIGQILLPAWLLHGFFDASLMAYSAIKKVLDLHKMYHHNFKSDYQTTSTNPPEVEPGGGETVEVDQGVPILMYAMVVPFIAMIYFSYESFYQRERLELLDKKNRIQA